MNRRAQSVASSAALLTLVVAAGPVFAQQSKSAPLVKEFAQLAGPEMRYVATKVPDTEDEFVGGLHIPGVQLIVIWARYEEPSLLDDMIAKRNYQGVYTDLNSASYTVADSRVFFEDLREDGFFHKRQDDNSAFDVYETSGKRVQFDGDWKKQQMSEKEYMDIFTAADERYARALTFLLAELKKGS